MTRYKPKVKAPNPLLLGETNRILREESLTTVCEESGCPNRAECYARGTATFMILGDTCTRACRFCNVKTGRGEKPDPAEPMRIARAVKRLGLKYAVITSVDRDDLKDYGSSQFIDVVNAVKELTPEVKVELLTPDFKGEEEALERIVLSGADKLAHNEETVRRLSSTVRPQSSYDRSLSVLRYYAKRFYGPVKSSLMVGLGESEEELLETMEDLLDAGVRELTVGQYLQPSPSHIPVAKYYPQEFFEKIAQKGEEMGFESVMAGVLVRSSYYAENM